MSDRTLLYLVDNIKTDTIGNYMGTVWLLVIEISD